jgi:hypothetical protein
LLLCSGSVIPSESNRQLSDIESQSDEDSVEDYCGLEPLESHEIDNELKKAKELINRFKGKRFMGSELINASYEYNTAKVCVRLIATLDGLATDSDEKIMQLKQENKQKDAEIEHLKRELKRSKDKEQKDLKASSAAQVKQTHSAATSAVATK